MDQRGLVLSQKRIRLILTVLTAYLSIHCGKRLRVHFFITSTAAETCRVIWILTTQDNLIRDRAAAGYAVECTAPTHRL